MSDGIKITRLANGFEVCFRDPDIVAANKKLDGKGMSAWRDPEVEMAFESADAVVSFLGKYLEKLTTAESFDTAFMKALKTE